MDPTEKDASPQVPRDYPFNMHAVGGQTLLVYSQSDAGQDPSNPNPPTSSETGDGGGGRVQGSN